jgi:hypothetical protein
LKGWHRAPVSDGALAGVLLAAANAVGIRVMGLLAAPELAHAARKLAPITRAGLPIEEESAVAPAVNASRPHGSGALPPPWFWRHGLPRHGTTHLFQLHLDRGRHEHD